MRPDWLAQPPAPLDEQARAAAAARQARLTKPPGSLGRLEGVVETLAAMQGRERPDIEPPTICVFAADHGVAAEGVSAFPQAVTVEMLRNFAAGGAAISVLARQLGAGLEVVDVGSAHDPGPITGVHSARVAAGTANLSREAAMQPAQLAAALKVGREALQRAAGAGLFIGGDMGIANTTSAAALACAFTGLSAERLAGPGTGLDAGGVARKARVISAALDLHGAQLDAPWEVLRRLGGLEIAALAGAFIAAAQQGVPVLVDGFIAGAAALAAERLLPGARTWFLFAHQSAEPGHRLLLETLDARPLLDLGMRLGEGSGAAVAVPLLRLACALHAGMATFDEAGVSDGQ